MAKAEFSADTLRIFLEDERIATLAQLKEALGTTGTMTVFRKLKALGYRSSYSHRGQYYTLGKIPDFDEQGLWDWHFVWFSRYGNLVEALSHELRAAIVLFFSLLDERQRRLYAGLEAQKFGHGGDRKIADLLGLDVHTVAKGRGELFDGEVDADRLRRKGGGRKLAEKPPRA